MHLNYFSLGRVQDKVAFDLGPMTPSLLKKKKIIYIYILEYILNINFNNFIL